MGLQKMDEHCMFVDLSMLLGCYEHIPKHIKNTAIIQGPLNVLVYNPSKASSIYSMGIPGS